MQAWQRGRMDRTSLWKYACGVLVHSRTSAWPRIILLEGLQAGMLLEERNKVGLQDLLVGRHVDWTVKEVERCLMIMAEGGPHHDTPSSPTVCLTVVLSTSCEL